MPKTIPILILGLLLNGCGFVVGTGAFRALDQLESQLERGMSTKDDVERLLGSPNGTGHAAFPFLENGHEIWYYADVKLTGMEPQGGVIDMEFRQQILMVFFKGERFDGFLWTSNSLSTEVKERFRFF